MPAISLVVCLHKQRELLERLLQKSAGSYDDLVVVHDGPDESNLRSLVETAGGRFFERPRENQQEPHWPFAWGQTRHDWILKLDADEYPSEAMKSWLNEFRRAPEPPAEISGYTCIWPMWRKDHAISTKWPAGRILLFHRQRVRFFGMVEQGMVPDGHYVPLNLILHHEVPGRVSHNLRNILIRKQAYRWREVIALSLLGKPTDLACWRWESETWPPEWEQIRSQPIRTALRRLIMGPLRTARDQWRVEGKIFPLAALGSPIHHALICWEYRRQVARKKRAEQLSSPGKSA